MDLNRFILLFLAMSSSDPLEVEKNLTGTVGGNITLPDAVPQYGSLLLHGRRVIVMVRNRELEIHEDIYMNRLHWNKTSGFFTLTNLQRNDSGIYIIDSKRGRVFTASYNLTVYEPMDIQTSPGLNLTNRSSDNNLRHGWVIIGVTLSAVAVVSLTAFSIWKCFRNNNKTSTEREGSVDSRPGVLDVQ